MIRARRRRVILSAVALALLAVAALTTALLVGTGERSPRPAGLVFGVVGNGLDGNTRSVMDGARHLGVSLVREEVRWAEIEPRHGQWHWGRTDRVFGAAAKRGLRVLPLLFTTPPWLSRQRTQLPPSLLDWRRFTARVVRRYGPGGVFWRRHPDLDSALAPPTWEVWNEPWYPQFSPPAPDPARYARVVVAAAAGVRDSGIRVGLLAAMTNTYVDGQGATRDWVAAMAGTPGLAQAIAGIAVHPYAVGSPVAVTAPDRFDRVDGIEAGLRAIGVGARPLWVTEVGWSTCTGALRCVSRPAQATYLRQLLDVIGTRYRRTVRAVVVYDLMDLPGTKAEPEANFGLSDRAGHPKPAYAVLARAARGR